MSSLVHEFFNGAIVAWSGYLSKIPRGWTLCDGQNGTPDLREKFVRGSPNGIEAGGTGGDPTHNHLFLDDGHAHPFQAGNKLASGTDINGGTDTGNSWGYTDDQNTEPPFYKLAYIMEWEGW